MKCTGSGFKKLLFGSWCPYDWGKTKGQWASLPSRLCAALMPHHQGFTSPIYLILFGPPTRAPLFMHYVKKMRLLSLFFPPPSLSISHPLPAHPPIYLPLTPLPPPLLTNFFSSSLLPGPSPCFHPFRPARTGVYVSVREFVWDQSFYFLFFPVDWLPARTVKALPAARTWKMHRISLW